MTVSVRQESGPLRKPTQKAQLELTNEFDSDVRSNIVEQLVAFNVTRGGAHERTLLAVLIKDPETGVVIGGLWGRTSWKWLTIETLFIPETHRGSGLGSEAMKLAEQEAVKRGCIGAWVDTHSFQAPGFYKRLGYHAFGVIQDYPPGHSRLFLQKRL